MQQGFFKALSLVFDIEAVVQIVQTPISGSGEPDPEASPQYRSDAVAVVSHFCHNYPAVRVEPTEADVTRLRATAASLPPAAVPVALGEELEEAARDGSWRPMLRAICALAAFVAAGGPAAFVAASVTQELRELLRYLTREVPQCRMRASELLSLADQLYELAFQDAQAPEEEGAATEPEAELDALAGSPSRNGQAALGFPSAKPSSPMLKPAALRAQHLATQLHQLPCHSRELTAEFSPKHATLLPPPPVSVTWVETGAEGKKLELAFPPPEKPVVAALAQAAPVVAGAHQEKENPDLQGLFSPVPEKPPPVLLAGLLPQKHHGFAAGLSRQKQLNLLPLSAVDALHLPKYKDAFDFAALTTTRI